MKRLCSRFRPALLCCFVLMPGFPFSGPLLAAEGAEPPAAPKSDSILPVIIEAPSDCPIAFPRGMNNGTLSNHLAIVGLIHCDDGAFPVTWQNGTWLRQEQIPISRAAGEWAEAMSVSDGPIDEGVVTFVVNDFDDETANAWVSTAGQPPIPLTTHSNGMQSISAMVTSDGKYIVGTSETGVAQWARTADGWLLIDEIAPGSPAAISADGSTVVGNAEPGAPWVWTATPEGGELVWLTSAAIAYDVSHNGSIVVGTRLKPYLGHPGPVYWVREDQEWRMRYLPVPGDKPAWAVAAAEVDGQSIIVGNVRYASDGKSDRAVAWIPGADGEYGLPIGLDSASGSATSSTKVVDINRNGAAVGWSREQPTAASHQAVVWQVVEQPRQSITGGHAGAWYKAETSGQGLLIDVEPSDQFIFLAWFTFTDSAEGTPGEQHWYTAQGHYSEPVAYLALYETLGGEFDDSKGTVTNPVGRVGLSFADCHRGEFSYELDVDGREGTIPLQRLLPGSGAVCDQKQAAGPATRSVNINGGMDGAWIDGNVPGQGFLFDVQSNPDGGNFIFAAWLTFGDGTASGQRWLTAQGDFSGATAELPVHETLGGRFDDARSVETRAAGTMRIDFSDCSNALLTYSLDDGQVSGEMAITRLLPGGQALCEELSAPD